MSQQAKLDYESRLDDYIGALAPKAEHKRRPPRYAHGLSCVLAFVVVVGNIVTYQLETTEPLRDAPFRIFPIQRGLWIMLAIAGIYYGEFACHFRDYRRNIARLALIVNVCLLIGMAIALLWPMFGWFG